MKIGIRDINIKNRIRSRTTAKLKRRIKSSINPFYGKKGMGWINNPRKALYNKIYNKTTISAEDALKACNRLLNSNGCDIDLKPNEYTARIKCNRKMLKIFMWQIGLVVLTFLGFYPCFIIAILLMLGYIKPFLTYQKERKA